MPKIARPEDMANAVVFLSSDKLAGHITGQTLVIAGGEGGKWTGVGRQIRALMLSPVVPQRLTMYISAHRQADLEALRQHVEAGHLTPIVGKTYPLPEVTQAIRHLEEGRAQGKLAVTV